MNRRIALTLTALAILGAAPAARAAVVQWRLVTEAPISHKATLAAFADEKNGVTAGYAGAMFYTHDGGKTWTSASNRSACRFGLEVVPGAAYSAGNQGDVRMSDDGGEHWLYATGFGASEPDHSRFLSFADARRGVIPSPSELAITADGAESWGKLALPKGIGRIAAVSLSEQAGALGLRLLDTSGAMFESADGGKTWAEAKSPLQTGVVSRPAPYAAMRFHGAEGVLVAFADSPEGIRGHVYRTADGGKTWTEDAAPPAFPAGAVHLSFDGKLITVYAGGTLRLYRAS